MVTSTNRPTDRPTNRQGEYRAICLFRKLENRKKAEICKNQNSSHVRKMQKGEKEQFASLQQGACSKFTGIIKSREVQLPFGIKPTQMLD